jgi:hypothetical protein
MSSTMPDRLEAWNDHSAICVIAVGSHGDPLDLAQHEVRAFIQRLEVCLANEARDPDRPAEESELRESWAITLRHLATCRYYLPEVLTTPGAIEAERTWNAYLHKNELGLALSEAEVMGQEQQAPAEYWEELRAAAASMGLEEEAASYAARSAA